MRIEIGTTHIMEGTDQKPIQYPQNSYSLITATVLSYFSVSSLTVYNFQHFSVNIQIKNNR